MIPNKTEKAGADAINRQIGKIDRVFLIEKSTGKIKEKKDERIIRNFKGITPGCRL